MNQFNSGRPKLRVPVSPADGVLSTTDIIRKATRLFGAGKVLGAGWHVTVAMVVVWMLNDGREIWKDVGTIPEMKERIQLLEDILVANGLTDAAELTLISKPVPYRKKTP